MKAPISRPSGRSLRRAQDLADRDPAHALDGALSATNQTRTPEKGASRRAGGAALPSGSGDAHRPVYWKMYSPWSRSLARMYFWPLGCSCTSTPQKLLPPLSMKRPTSVIPSAPYFTTRRPPA